ncbi:MAG: hypothetical protein BECKG1743D_GA0114223_104821 [Candidatus Kentron sp. G]|nr:MAG: hypothetical protein BECKG1743D_GA0114223_104821 [Candidatus Kentron sp. G]
MFAPIAPCTDHNRSATSKTRIFKQLPRHPTGNNLPTLLAYLSQILVQLLCCNDSYIVHYAPVCARS